MYSAISSAMALLSLIAKVIGRQMVTAIVAVSPGIAPKIVPIRGACCHQYDAQRITEHHGEAFH